MLKQGQLQQEPRALSRQLLRVSKDGDPTTSLCNLSSAPSLTVKQVFTDVQAKPCVSACTHCFMSHHCAPLKSLTSVISALPFCFSHTGMMSCLNLLFSGQDSPSSLTFPTGEILQPLHPFSGILLVSVQHSHISLALGSPKVNTAPQCTSAGEELQPPQSACSSQVTLGGLHKGTLLAHVQFAVPLALRAFPEG